MKKHLLFIIVVSQIFCACQKESSDTLNYGTEVNTWSFTEGATIYKGHLNFGPVLNTFLQANNTYTIAFIGEEKTSTCVFDIVLSLVDLDFSTKTYQSGVVGTTYLNSFYCSPYDSSADYTYHSSNIGGEIGAVMKYTVCAYDASRDIVTIAFSGKAFDRNGNLVNIRDGKVTGKVQRI